MKLLESKQLGNTRETQILNHLISLFTPHPQVVCRLATPSEDSLGVDVVVERNDKVILLIQVKGSTKSIPSLSRKYKNQLSYKKFCIATIDSNNTVSFFTIKKDTKISLDPKKFLKSFSLVPPFSSFKKINHIHSMLSSFNWKPGTFLCPSSNVEKYFGADLVLKKSHCPLMFFKVVSSLKHSKRYSLSNHLPKSFCIAEFSSVGDVTFNRFPPSSKEKVLYPAPLSMVIPKKSYYK